VLFIGPAGTDTITPTTIGGKCDSLGYCTQITLTIKAADTAKAGMAIIIVQNPFTTTPPPVPLDSNAVLFPISNSEPGVSFYNSTLTVGANPQGIAVGDFNGDGKEDLAIVNTPEDSVTILLGNGDGTFTPTPGSPINLGNNLQPVAVVVGDFNNDDNLDLAVANETDNSVSILLGDGHGGFTVVGSRFSTMGQNPVALVAVDLDGDNNLDLAVLNQSDTSCKGNGSVDLLVGDGAGNFSQLLSGDFNWYQFNAGYISANPICVGASPNSIVAADFNGDGAPDLAVTAGSGGSCNPGVGVASVMYSNAQFLCTQGLLTCASNVTPVSFCAGKQPRSLAAGDFNGDSAVDLAVADLGDGSVSILLNDGTGAFKEPALNFLTHSAAPNALVVGDFNSDQVLDLAVLSPAGVTIMPGDGKGNFSTVQGPFNAGTTPVAAATADFNGDGRLDLAVTNLGNMNQVSIMLTSPPLTFTPSSLDFGNAPESAVSSAQFITIANSSNASLTLTNIGPSGRTPFSSTSTRAR